MAPFLTNVFAAQPDAEDTTPPPGSVDDPYPATSDDETGDDGSATARTGGDGETGNPFGGPPRDLGDGSSDDSGY